MLIQSADENVQIEYDELATLKQLAKKGALSREIKISGSKLADELNISTQTASRRLQTLWEVGLIYRQPVNDGQYLFILPEGKEVLESEFADYRAILRDGQQIQLEGRVVDGKQQAEEFLSLSGYRDQFEERLGYEPYPGTLNVELSADSQERRDEISMLEPIHIDEWEKHDRTYGAVYCYPGTFEHENALYKPIHLITPDRTEYDDDIAEVLAPEHLRDRLSLQSGDYVTVNINR